jgi:plastocyanin
MDWFKCLIVCFMLPVTVSPALSQLTVVGKIIVEDGQRKSAADVTGRAVVWLEAIQSVAPSWPSPHRQYSLAQRDHIFEPHLMIIPVGATVNFPNHDPIFHNVFSMFRGKRFDVGLYEAGESKKVVFDKPGVSYVFCNIHPEMGAVVIALRAPFYGVSDSKGTVKIEHVPAGRYRLRMWAEGASDETLDQLARDMTVTNNTNLGPIRIQVIPSVNLTHPNKFGFPYDPDVRSYPHPAP